MMRSPTISKQKKASVASTIDTGDLDIIEYDITITPDDDDESFELLNDIKTFRGDGDVESIENRWQGSQLSLNSEGRLGVPPSGPQRREGGGHQNNTRSLDITQSRSKPKRLDGPKRWECISDSYLCFDQSTDIFWGNKEPESSRVQNKFVAREAIDYLIESGAARTYEGAKVLFEKIAFDFKQNVFVRDRKYHMRTYKQCFVAREAVDFLVECGAALSRKGAIDLGRALQRAHLFHHVCGDHAFKDEYLFFRFSKCEPTDRVVSDFLKRIVLRDRKYHLKTYKKCFVASEAVTYLVSSGHALTRKNAVELGIAMQSMNIFDHVTGDHVFQDGYFFFRILDKFESSVGDTAASGTIRRSKCRRKMQDVQNQMSMEVTMKEDEKPQDFDFPFTIKINKIERRHTMDMASKIVSRSWSPDINRVSRRQSLDTAPSVARRRSSSVKESTEKELAGFWGDDYSFNTGFHTSLPKSKTKTSVSADKAPILVTRLISPDISAGSKTVVACEASVDRNISPSKQFPCRRISMTGGVIRGFEGNAEEDDSINSYSVDTKSPPSSSTASIEVV